MSALILKTMVGHDHTKVGKAIHDRKRERGTLARNCQKLFAILVEEMFLPPGQRK